jgi:hypothetical protein
MHQVARIFLVQNGEITRDAGARAEAPQQAVSGAVKRATMHLPRRGPHEAFDAREHFLGRPSREREQQYTLGLHALLEQVGHAVHERTRFPRAGARHDQEWPFAVHDGRPLLVV